MTTQGVAVQPPAEAVYPITKLIRRGGALVRAIWPFAALISGIVGAVMPGFPGATGETMIVPR